MNSIIENSGSHFFRHDTIDELINKPSFLNKFRKYITSDKELEKAYQEIISEIVEGLRKKGIVAVVTWSPKKPNIVIEFKQFDARQYLDNTKLLNEFPKIKNPNENEYHYSVQAWKSQNNPPRFFLVISNKEKTVHYIGCNNPELQEIILKELQAVLDEFEQRIGKDFKQKISEAGIKEMIRANPAMLDRLME